MWVPVLLFGPVPQTSVSTETIAWKKTLGRGNRRPRTSMAPVEQTPGGAQGPPLHLLAPSIPQPQRIDQPPGCPMLHETPWSRWWMDLGRGGGPLVGSRSPIWIGATDICVHHLAPAISNLDRCLDIDTSSDTRRKNQKTTTETPKSPTHPEKTTPNPI